MKIILRRDNLQYWLLENNMYQMDLAAKLRIGEIYLSTLLAGKKHPSPILRSKLMRFTKLGFEELFEVIRDDNHKKEAKDDDNSSN